MIIQAVRWQAHGSGETLDAQLDNDRGWSKVHALAEPLFRGPTANPAEWIAYEKLGCGRAVPNTAGRIGERYNEPLTCKVCANRRQGGAK